MGEYQGTTACRTKVIAQRPPKISESTAQRMARRRERERRKRRRMRIALIQRLLIVIGCGATLAWCVWQPQAAYSKTQFGQTALARFEDKDEREFLTEGDKDDALFVLAQQDEYIREVYKNRELYSEELITLLLGNPEIGEFMANYFTAEKTVQGGFSEDELAQDAPLFMQWDARWGYVPYGDSNIGIAGCAPTCLSMVIFSLTGNADATPDAIAAYSMENGHYVPGAGTAWSLITEVGKEYGVNTFELGLDEDAMKRQLDYGGQLILSMRPGDFTTTGHFIVIYDYDENGFFVNDPYSRERSSKQWTYKTLKGQIKNIWASFAN